MLVEPKEDRCSHQHRYRGDEPLNDDAHPRPVIDVLLEQLTPHAREIDLRANEPRAWMMHRCINARCRSNQRLLWQACILAVLLVILRNIIANLAPSVLLLLSGIWWMSQQPWRERSQQWWCLLRLLWVQDVWYGFRLHNCPAEKPRPIGSVPRGERMLDLNAALRCHAIWLSMQPEPGVWGRPLLTDTIKMVVEWCRELHNLEHRQRQRQQLVQLLLTLAAVMEGVSLMADASTVIDQLLLILLVLLVAIGLSSTGPFLPREQLLEHQIILQEELMELERSQRMETLSDPKLRAAVEAAVQRIGVELVDLCDDSLYAARDRRRWLP